METNHTCCVCQSDSQELRLSCSHYVCPTCANNMINENQYVSCPKCGIICQEDIKTLFDIYISNPINKLFFNYGFAIDNVLWTYSGFRENKWLYDKKQCSMIEDAYKKYLNLSDSELSTESPETTSEETSSNNSEFNIDITINGNTVTYILNFENMKQYPINDNTKKRNLCRFTLYSYDDITENNIIGVAGKKF